MAAHSKLKTLLGPTTFLSGSTNTSAPVFVGDCRLLSISVMSQVAGASVVTVSLSNTGGFSTDSVFFWSTATLIQAQGIYTVDPGARWIRVERASASTTTVQLNRYYE